VRAKGDFPRRVRSVENSWIPLADGTRLAARIWLPEDAARDPVPAILEYIPYRKGDWTAVRDSLRHPYVAGHGYACVRVDMRGSGDSDGLLLDEYLPQELDDGVEVIAWLARQPWCTGKVGMVGKSWGGFNGLQIAARRPPELVAVISVCSTDDRYADDVHYMGGCVLASDMLSWAGTMLAFNARPPDPAVVGDRWRAIWLERLERTPPFVEAWLAHQRRDAFWKHGSVCEDYAAIECPVYLVGGWADAYTNAILRLLEGLSCPRKGLIGPWAHLFPDDGVPGPQIGWLQEALRWWDRWLKDIDTGVMDEPMLRAWMQDWAKPRPFHAERPGRWVGEPSWPSPDVKRRPVALGFAGAQILGSQACGLDSGAWLPWGNSADFPPDQRGDDGLSLAWTSEPLTEPLEILGFPEVELELAADRPRALVAVRLCDVASDGASLLVTRGLLNLTHRESHEEPRPLEPGRRYRLTVRLNAIAHAFRAGHRLRVSVSPTYWPFAWPSPEPATLTVFAGRLDLPVRPARNSDAVLRPFEEPEGAKPLPVERTERAAAARTVRRDVGTGRHELRVELDYLAGGRPVLPGGLEYDERGLDAFAIVEGDPLSADARSEWRIEIGRGAWQTRVGAASRMWSDAEAFHVESAVEAYEGAERVFTTARRFSVPRDLL